MFKSKYFNLGRVVCTDTVINETKNDKRFALEITDAIMRYCNKDWGNLCDDDKKRNDDALKCLENLYLLAAYTTCKGKIYIITNRKSEIAGDNVTTILFSYEY